MDRFLRTVAIVSGVALCASAAASVAQRAGIDELTEASDVAVLGVVADAAVVVGRDRGEISTDHRVKVEATWFGAPAAEIVVRVRGGRVGTVVQETIGSARLDVGSRVVLFLSRDASGRHHVVAQAQGAFHVERDPATGALVCRNSTQGLTLVHPDGRPAPATPLVLPLADLERQVRAARARVEERRSVERAARARRLEELRRRAQRHAEVLRGRPGGGED